MFKQGLYPFIPPLKGAKVLIAVLWSLGVLFVAIGLHAAQTGDTPIVSPPPIVSPAIGGPIGNSR